MGKLILVLISRLLVNLSPQMREQLNIMLESLQAKAKQTANPIDDIFVALLRALLGFDE